jgi:hypothetical protein
MTAALSTRIAAGVTAAYLLDLNREAVAAPAPPARPTRVPQRRHGGRAHGAGRRDQASRRARLGATRGGSSGCLG